MVRRSPAPFLALSAIAIALTLVACGGDDEDATGAATTPEAATTDDQISTEAGASASGPGGTVTIGETEYALHPSHPTVEPGEVTFDVSNDGSTVHDLEIEGEGLEEKTDPIEPGDTARLAVALDPGTYELYCTIDGHRDQGMEGTLTVQ
ncbi:MAG: hypothetical protein GEU88_16570 [Solirubrobacterales bacterium]|nr:hypothetical protein [Solirubrobacterales bacterium]